MKNIIFSPIVENYPIDNNTRPQPAVNFIPDWFKNMPHYEPSDGKKPLYDKLRRSTVKKCPSFSEIFKYGFCLLAPCDIYINIDKEKKKWHWETSDGSVTLDEHADWQFKNYFPDENIITVLKINYPWYGITPKGYACLQIPMLYNYNPDWYVPFGIIETDIYHELNPQLIITTDKNEILIKKGTPLSYLYPIKKETFKAKYVKFDKIKNKYYDLYFKVRSSFTGSFYKNIKYK